MKTIKVFLASSDELAMERLQFDSLFNHLNRIFRPRGLYLELSKWEYLDSSMGSKHKQEEYNEELKTCDMCMVIYWTKFGEYTAEELTTAYTELKSGRNPKKLYVFFKEPGAVTPELQAFKDSFVTEFGHFYCRFENVDSMRLHFLLQLEAYQNNEMKDLVKIEDSKVKVDGKSIVDLDNVPFAAKNREYRRMKDEIAKIESEIRTLESVLAAGHNEAISELLGKKRSELYYAKEELSKHENLLFDTALRIVRQQSEKISERMTRAIEAFEDGRASDANTILDEAMHDAKVLREDIARTRTLLEQQKESAAVSISELMLKASVVLADESKVIDERIDSAEDIYLEAYALANECDYDREKHMELLESYGEFLSTYAKFNTCIKINGELLDLNISILGENHPETARIYNNIGLVYSFIGDYDRALECYAKALEIRLSIDEDDNTEIAVNYNNVGLVYYSLGDYDRALEHFMKALNIQWPVLGKNHPDLSRTYNNTGLVYYSLGDYDKALEYYEKALKISLSEQKDNDINVATNYNNIGLVYYSLGDYDSALEYYDKARKIQLSALGENHTDIAKTYNNMGLIYGFLGDYDSALDFYKKSLKISLSVLKDNNPDIATYNNNIGLTYYYKGDYYSALEYYEKALKISMSIHGENYPAAAVNYNNIGLVYFNLDDYDRALECYEKALKVGSSTLDENHPTIATTYNNIGTIYYSRENYKRALEYYEKALKIQLSVLGEDHSDVATTYNNIGAIHESFGDNDCALKYYEKALEILLPILGENHQHTKTIIENIDALRQEVDASKH